MPCIVFLYYRYTGRLLHTSHGWMCCDFVVPLRLACLQLAWRYCRWYSTFYIHNTSDAYHAYPLTFHWHLVHTRYQYTCTIKVDLVNPQVLTEQEQDELPVSHIDSGTVDERVSQRFRYVYVSLSSFLFRLLCSCYPQLLW